MWLCGAKPSNELDDAGGNDSLLGQEMQPWTPSQQVPTGQCMNERAREMEFAKAHIAKAKNGRELLSLAEKHVKEDWLGNIRELGGNIYRCTAFGKHRGYHLGQWSEDGMKAIARLFGFITVWLLQVAGPPAIFLSTWLACGIEDEKRFRWETWEISTADWHHAALTKCLSMGLTFVFCLNAFYDALDERREWKKVDAIFLYLQRITPKCSLPGEKYLYLGAFTNCWLKLWCCLDSYVIIGAAESPKECIFDALGLLFLFKLDDISGDVSFVSEDAWPGHRLGWVYENMVDPEKEYTPADVKLEKAPTSNCSHVIVRGVHLVTVSLLGAMSIVLPILEAFTAFSTIKPPDGGWKKG